jgi:hypothetical protein
MADLAVTPFAPVIAWPAELPACAQSWDEQDVPVVVRTQMDIGPPKVRRRYTRTMRNARVGFTMTHAEAMRLRDFFELDTQGGVYEHQFVHPFRGELERFRFVEPPTIANLGALACTVSCSWEQL